MGIGPPKRPNRESDFGGIPPRGGQEGRLRFSVFVRGHSRVTSCVECNERVARWSFLVLASGPIVDGRPTERFPGRGRCSSYVEIEPITNHQSLITNHQSPTLV